MTRRPRPIRNVKPTVETCDGVRVHHDNLDNKIEAVEACFGLIPGWIGQWSRSGKVDGQTEAGAKGEQQ